MKKINYGAFCELYGKTLRNKVLEYILEMKDLDFAVSDITEEAGISKPKMYQIIRNLEKQGLIKKTRIVAGTQLYILNKESEQMKLLLKSFKQCLKLILQNYEEKPSTAESSAKGKCLEIMPV